MVVMLILILGAAIIAVAVYFAKYREPSESEPDRQARPPGNPAGKSEAKQ